MSRQRNEQELLRAEVESQLARARSPVDPVSPPGDLRHELQVHEIELEMQNEALRQSGVMLEESRDRYVDFYDFAPVGYLTLSHKALIAEINLTGATMLGDVRSKLLRRRFSEFLAPEHHDRWYRHFMDVQQQDDKLTCELDITRGDGQRLHVQLDSLRLVKNGHPPVVRIALTDITELKRAQTALRESESHQRVLEQQKLIQASLEGFWVTRTKDTRILEANNAFCEMVGYTREELLTKRISDLEAIESPDETAAHIKKVMEIGYARFETRHRHKQGHLVDLEVSTSYSAMNGGELFVFARNITERKCTEDALNFIAQRGWMDNAENFFDALVKYLGRTLGADYVIISRLAEDLGIAETVASFAAGTIVPNARYILKGTPCETVMGRRFCFYPQGVRQMFPKDTMLVELGAESYAGLPLWDSAGQPIGVIAIVDGRPLRDEARVSHILRLLAIRAAAELERERNDRILRQSERKFRTLAENIPDNLIRYDMQARAQYMNSTMMSDVAPDVLPVLGKSLAKAFPGNDAAAAHQRVIERAIATGIPGELEFQVPNPHGEMRIHHVRYVAEHDTQGEIVGALGIGRDITERKLAEQYEQFRSQTLELLSQGAPLQDLLEGIVLGVEQLKPDMICSILLLDGQGKRFCKGIGPSLPDFYNEGINGVEIGVGVGSCGTAAATGKRVIVDDIMTHPYWTPYKDLAARAGLAACWSEPVLSSSGQVLGTFAAYHRKVHSPTAFDISVIEKSVHLVSIAIERKWVEEALRASEQEFRTLAENLPDILVRYDREGRRSYANRALQRSFALTAGELIGKTVRNNNPTGMETIETYQRALEHTLATGERSEFEVQAVLPDGKLRTGLCFIAAERTADGRISGAISVTRDITERKRNEAELERHRLHLEKLVEDRTHALSIAKETAETATRAKSQFLAAASHDMRQPLQAIILFNEALAMTRLDKEQTRISNHLSKSVTSLGELLNELLDLSRLDAGMIEPQPVVIQARDLLGVIENEFDAVFREKNLSLRLFCPLGSLALFSDKNLLLTLLRNLVGNAVKYTTRGGVLVSIRRREDRALIQVWDTGIGIAPEQSDSIFEEYFQVGNPERDRAKGVGLGLSIVRRLSKLLGIGVGLRSREGKGSVFELAVPLADESNAPAPAMRASAPPKNVASARLAGKKIVVIEDDETVAEAIKFSLEIAGAHVTLFGTAEDALRSAKTIAADCYISDYRLPGMDGLQLLDAIQTNSEEPIKAVLLTGNTSTGQISVLQSCRWEVLFKPIDLPTLLAAIEQ